jgi:hypothetical protein
MRVERRARACVLAAATQAGTWARPPAAAPRQPRRGHHRAGTDGHHLARRWQRAMCPVRRSGLKLVQYGCQQ